MAALALVILLGGDGDGVTGGGVIWRERGGGGVIGLDLLQMSASRRLTFIGVRGPNTSPIISSSPGDLGRFRLSGSKGTLHPLAGINR